MDKIDITQLVPNFLLGDKNGWAMAKAIEKAMQIFFDKIQEGIDAALNPDKMPEWRLDELAHDMDVDWYRYDDDLETKRAVIKNSISVYRRLGTKYAVTQAVMDVFGAGRIEEWFEYDGTPSYFRVYTTNATALLENRARFIGLLDAVKPLRAVLDNIYYQGSSGEARAYSATVASGQEMKAYATAIKPK